MSTGFIDFSSLPLPYIFAVLSGYVLASVLAEDTSFWRKRESFEKILIGAALGLGLLFGTVLPIVWLAGFWSPLTMDSAIEVSSYYVLTFFLFLPLTSIITAKISRETILKIFGYAILFLPYVILAEYFFAFVLKNGIELYPDYLKFVLRPIGESFFVTSSFSFVFSMINLIIYQLFVTPLLARNENMSRYYDMRFGKRVRKTWKEKFSSFKWSIKRKMAILRLRLFSGKKLILIIVLILIIFSSIIIIPIDYDSPMLTPKLQISDENNFSSTLAKKEMVMEITQDGSYRDDFVVRYYDMWVKHYNVSLPSFPYAVKSLGIPNPSNYSVVGKVGFPEPFVTNFISVKNFEVTCDKNVSTSFLPNSNNVENMIFDFSNISSRTTNFNITYFQLFDSKNVSFECDFQGGELENNTIVDRYDFNIQNNENVTLNILEIVISALSVADVDHEAIEVYRDGDRVSHTANTIKIYSIDIEINPHTSTTIAVTIPRKMNQG